METLEPSNSRPPAREFVMMGVQLQEALRTGQGLDATLDAFCRAAFARKDLGQSITFLLSLVQKDVAKLAQLLQVRHLVAELSVGSQILSSLVAAQWDKTEQTDKLATLADGILAAQMSGTDLRSAAEFSTALAKTIAVLHPARSKALLNLTTPLMQGTENASMLKEAWDWQRAGELLAGKDMEFRRFWHQTLRQQRGDWFWDTAEGQKALAGLDSGTEDLNVRGGLFRRSIPAWAWQGDNLPEELRNAMTAEERPAAEQRPAAPPMPVPAPQPPPATVSPRRERGAGLIVGGSLALLACAAIVVGTQIDFGHLSALIGGEKEVDLAGPMPAAVEKPTAQPLTGQTTTLTPPATSGWAAPQPTPVEPAAPLPAHVDAKPVVAAQMLEVATTARHGWVKTPIGTEFRVTPDNATAGKVKDEEGRLWRLPADPKLVAEVKGLYQAVNPYTNEVVTVPPEQWKPAQQLSFADTGWTFGLPTSLPDSAPKKAEPSTAPQVAAADSAKMPAKPAEHAAAAPAQKEAVPMPPPVKDTVAATKESVPATMPAPAPTAAPTSQPNTVAIKQESVPAPVEKETAATPTASVATTTPPAAEKPAESPAPATPAIPAPVMPAVVDTATPPKPPTATTEPKRTVATATSKPKAKKAPAAKASNTGKLVAAHRPTGEAQKRELSQQVASTDTRKELVFVTRANSIRMSYKGGYWESTPGAYMQGAGASPGEWARDMTVRERSSGTIPPGYMFKVVDRGVVRVLPEPPN